MELTGFRYGTVRTEVYQRNRFTTDDIIAMSRPSTKAQPLPTNSRASMFSPSALRPDLQMTDWIQECPRQSSPQVRPRYSHSPLRNALRDMVQYLSQAHHYRARVALQRGKEEGRQLLLHPDLQLPHETHGLRGMDRDTD